MKKIISISILVLLVLVGWQLTQKPSEEVINDAVESYNEQVAALADDAAVANITQHFTEDALVGDVKIVDCTLSGGAQTECYKFTVVAAPRTETVGPWCPTNISDTDETGGLWLEDGEVYDVDGEFIKGLASFYDDENWQLYNETTGEISVTNTQLACESAARPNVAEEYQNHCVKCELSYFESSEQTYVIPITPILSDESASINAQNGVAISFTGVRFDGPAPVEAIKSAYTIAAFDDCGGHVNPVVGYHYHIATDCPDQVKTDETHAPIIGLALDGHTLHTQDNLDGTSPIDLDECNGHEVDGIGYHYHAGDAGSNQILGCYQSEYGCVLDDATGICDASANVNTGGRPDGPPPADGARPTR